MAIQANWIEVITPEGSMPAWWARPEAPPARVLVLPEVFGVNGRGPKVSFNQVGRWGGA